MGFVLPVKPLPFLAIKSVITHSHLKKVLKLEFKRRQHTVKISANMCTLVTAKNVANPHNGNQSLNECSFMRKLFIGSNQPIDTGAQLFPQISGFSLVIRDTGDRFGNFTKS